MLKTLAALFGTKREAQDAERDLARRGIGGDKVQLVQGSTRGVSVPAEDRAAYDEGLRRGGTLLLVRVEEVQFDAVVVVLEASGAVDLDAREREWRAQGWTGGTAAPAVPAASPAGLPAPTGPGAQEQAIPVMEERLVIGKRDVTRGTVRVRVHVREVPVEVPVHLREEHAVVERHPVDRPVTPADADAFREKVVAVDTVVEEPVVAKQAVVVEEIVVHKDVAQRVETVRDTVRRTVVEVEGGPAARAPETRPPSGRG